MVNNEKKIFYREVKKAGQTGRIAIPKRYIGLKARVTIFHDYFICLGCNGTVPISEKIEKYNICTSCYRIFDNLHKEVSKSLEKELKKDQKLLTDIKIGEILI